MAFQKKEQVNIIVKSKKETVEDIIAGVTTEKDLRDQKRVLTDNNNESALLSLENNKPLILPTPIDPLMTGSFILEDDSHHTSTPRLTAQKLKGKTPATPPINKKTRSMISSNKSHFRYINGVALLHKHMRKVLNALQSGNYLGLSKAQKL